MSWIRRRVRVASRGVPELSGMQPSVQTCGTLGLSRQPGVSVGPNGGKAEVGFTATSCDKLMGVFWAYWMAKIRFQHVDHFT